MKKRFLSIITLFVFMIALVACTKNKDESKKNATNKSETKKNVTNKSETKKATTTNNKKNTVTRITTYEGDGIYEGYEAYVNDPTSSGMYRVITYYYEDDINFEKLFLGYFQLWSDKYNKWMPIGKSGLSDYIYVSDTWIYKSIHEDEPLWVPLTEVDYYIDLDTNDYIKTFEGYLEIDVENKSVTRTCYELDYETREWVGSEKDKKYYNEFDKEYEYISYRWIDETVGWREARKVMTLYDEQGEETDYIEYIWDTTTNDWKVVDGLDDDIIFA